MGSLAVLALVFCVLLPAQQTPTLHVYTDRVQIPVLVLGPGREELPPLTPDRFQVRLDVRQFKTDVRRQGEDPLQIVLLVDGSDPQNALAEQFSTQIDALFPGFLTGKDYVTVYAMDGCMLRRFRKMELAEPHSIAAAIHEAESFPAWPLDASRACPTRRVNLWDTLYALTDSMEGLRHRSIVLAITNGVDHGSIHSPEAIRSAAVRNGVSIFSIAQKGKVPHGAHAGGNAAVNLDSPSGLAMISEGSGGIVTEASPEDAATVLPRVIHMIRGRYILEFPRPKGMFSTHYIHVSIRGMDAFVRTAGLSFPVVPQREVEVIDPANVKPLEIPGDTPGAPEPGGAVAPRP